MTPETTRAQRKGRARLVGALLASASLVWAAGASAETLRVYFNAGHGFDTYLAAIEQFEADNPGWEVALERFQWPDMRTKLVADFAVDQPPDLVAEPGGWVTEFALQGLLHPLDEFIAADGAAMGYPDDWQPVSVAKNEVDGSHYGVQLHLTCATLVYNADILAAAGFDAPPETWEEFRDVAIATTKGGVFGFAPNPSLAYYFPWILQNDGGWYDAESKELTIADPATQEAIQFLSDLIHKDHAATPPVSGSDYEGPQRLFTAGRVAMIITGPWDVTPIKTGNPELNWKIAPSLTHDAQATFAGGVSLMIPKDAAHKEMAWELAKRLTALEVEVPTSLQYGMTMPRKSWQDVPEVQADPILASFGSCLDYARDPAVELRKAGLYSSNLENLLQGAIEEVVYSGEPAQAVFDGVAAEMQSEVGK